VLRVLQASLGLISFSALASAQLITRPVPPADQVDRGQKLFVATCGFCHGATAKGGEGGPDLVRSVIVLDDENAEKIGPVVKSGRPDRGMPMFDLPEDQVKDIAAFLRSRTQAAIDRGKYPVLNLVTGDAKAGEAYFTAQCAMCHSASGDLSHVGAKYTPEALEIRFLYPARGPDRKKVEATVTPSSGASVSGTVEYIDDFTIAIRDAAEDYHSWPRESVKVELRDPYAAHQDLLRKYSDADMHNLLTYLVTLK